MGSTTPLKMTSLPPSQTTPLQSRERLATLESVDGYSKSQTAQAVQRNAAISLYDKPDDGLAFQTTTIAPSPPPGMFNSSSQQDLLSSAASTDWHLSDSHTLHPNLRLQTDIASSVFSTPAHNNSTRKSSDFDRPSKPQPIGAPTRTPSIKQVIANSYGSHSNYGGSAPSSTISSPMLGSLTDITPLPSPLMSHDSPGPWKKLAARKTSREYMMPGGADSAFVTSNGESISSAILNQPKRKAYHGLVTNASDPPTDTEKGADTHGHQRNRSVSEYVPEHVQAAKARQHTVSGSYVMPESPQVPMTEPQMRREPNLAVKRGIAPIPRPPTPPSSRAGGESSDSDSCSSNVNAFHLLKSKSRYQYYDAYTIGDQKRRRWRSLRLLGEGTFSKVMLATTQAPVESVIHEDDVFGITASTTADHESEVNRSKLVAIKICEHGPKGGASEERVEMSLKRELEIMKSIHHPSLVNLIAWSIEETRALLVMSYCPGGDLFDVASQHRDLLVPALLRRILAELVGAVQFLHERHIVHRDIKLENVLVNLPENELAKNVDWITYPYSIITLTDLGLSRRVADDEKLTTRCGSDDYAAPEVIMGQSYDGRAVDAWSLGVLLYALLEARLPFDPTPGMPESHKQRSKTSHRIARVEWCWVEFAGDDGDHEGDEAKFVEMGLKGAMEITEGLLKRARSRWTVEKVANLDWIENAIAVEGGIRFREEDTPEEVAP